MGRKVKSLRRQVIAYWLGISVIMLAVFLVYAIYNIYRYRADFINSNTYVMNSYTNQLEGEMESLEDYVKSISVANSHFNILQQKNISENTLISALYYIENMLENRVSGLYYEGGLFLYDKRSDFLRSKYSISPSEDEKIYECNRLLKAKLKQVSENGSSYLWMDTAQGYYIVYVFKVQELYLGYLINLEQYLEGTGLLEEDVQLAVYQGEKLELTLGETYFTRDTLESDRLAVRSYENGMRWVFVCGNTQKGNLQLWSIYPGWSFFRLWNNTGFWLLFLIVPLIIMCFIWKIYRNIRTIMLQPIDHLIRRLTVMSGKKLSGETKAQPVSQEFCEIYNKIDEMLDKIDALQKEKYAKELEANAAKLQYYQLQVNPHFFLNCLNNINAMIVADRSEVAIKGFIHSLSYHFRYVFKNQASEVTLAQEMEEVKQYCEISKMRLGQPILVQTDIEESLMHIPVPILCIQAFVENSVKYALIAGKILVLKISAVRREDTSDTYVCIRIQDNGDGFKEEQLGALNSPVEHFQYHSRNVGIDNVKYRLHLMYGKRAKTYFYNDPGGGAVSELILPQIKDGGII